MNNTYKILGGALLIAIFSWSTPSAQALDCDDDTTESAHDIMHNRGNWEKDIYVISGEVLEIKTIDNYEAHLIEVEKVKKGMVPAKVWVNYRIDPDWGFECANPREIGERAVFEISYDYETELYTGGRSYAMNSDVAQFYLDHSDNDYARIQGEVDRLIQLRESLMNILTQLKLVLNSLS